MRSRMPRSVYSNRPRRREARTVTFQPGIVIAPGPLDDYVPVCTADSKGSGGGDGPVSFEGGGSSRRERKASKPKLRMDLLNLHVRGRPVSFSASLKGLKGVQFKATVKM